MPPREHHDAGLGFFLASAGLVLVPGFLLSRYDQPLADMVLALCRLLLEPLALVSTDYATVLSRLQMLEPGTKDLAFATAVLGRVCRPWVLFVCLPLCLLLLKAGWRVSVLDVYRRTLTMKSLMQAQLPLSPCVAPVLNWPRSLLDEPLDSGPWMAARQPLQLAADAGLLVADTVPVPKEELLGPDNLDKLSSRWLGRQHNGLALDRARAEQLFAAQLGPRWQGFAALPAWQRKLASAFALFACEEKDAAQRLLDSLSLSFRPPVPAKETSFSLFPPRWKKACAARPCVLDTSVDTDLVPLINKALASPGVRRAIEAHSQWRNLALLALYELARCKGVLPTAEFIWLRPLDRKLYYLLNNVGRRTAWPEIAGAWAHYTAEKVVADMDPGSTGIVTPQVTEAVNALEAALYEAGWISPDMLSASVRDTLGATDS